VFVKLTKVWLTYNMIYDFYVFWLLIGSCSVALGVSLYAIVRVRIINKTLSALDWETLANLTGEVGAMKRSLQKTNNRINGMTSSDPATVLSELPKFQMAEPNVTPMNRGG